MINRLLLVVGLAMWLGMSVRAQVPSTFRYQAALQSNSGETLSNEQISFRISILRSEINRERIYSEFQLVTTDQFGMVNLEIGKGNIINGNLDLIDWSLDRHFLKIEIDENGGTQFREISEVELLTVPYALYAKKAGNVDDADANPENELQELVLEGNTLTITQGNAIELPLSADNDPTNEIQNLQLEGNELTISGGNTIILTEGTDSQTLSINGNQLSISSGNTVELPTASGGTYDPTLPVAIIFRGSTIFVHPTDNSESTTFGEFVATGATSDFDGEANTLAILEATGGGASAAQICADLEAFGFDDWYLPARAELDALFKQNYLFEDYGLEGYWSSTETASNKAWVINFLDGSLSDPTKNQAQRLRCIRRD